MRRARGEARVVRSRGGALGGVVGAVGVGLLVGLAAALAACAGPAPDSPAGRAETLATRLAGHPQTRRLSCESRSATDLLAAHGLPGYRGGGVRAAPAVGQPDLGFVGDVDGPAGRLPPQGYGVHAEPIAAVLRSFGLAATAERDRDLAWLRAETEAGRPVIVWVTGSCSLSRPVDLVDARGTSFRAVRGEHTVLVVGVRPTSVLVVDPADGWRRTFEIEEFDAAWALLGRRAVRADPPAAR